MIPEHVVEAVLELSIACRGGKNDQATVRVFAKYLADLDADDVRRAVTLWCLESQFFPTPAELRRVLERTSGLNAATAWEEACRQVSLCNRYMTPQWSDPSIGRAVVATSGSFQEFCDSPSDQFAAKRAKFFQVFDGLAAAAREESVECAADDIIALTSGRMNAKQLYGTGLNGKPDVDEEPAR